MRLRTTLVVCVLVSAAAPLARAQDRPFVFSLVTAPEASKPAVAFAYDVGVGDTAFRSAQSNGPEQRIGLQASLGRRTFVGRVGVASSNVTYQTSQQGEVLYSLFTQASSGVAVAVGGGMLREPGGTTAAPVGPSLHVAPPGGRWQLSAAGGPMFHPSDTGRQSGALRDLPPTSAARSYAFRTSFSCTF